MLTMLALQRSYLPPPGGWLDSAAGPTPGNNRTSFKLSFKLLRGTPVFKGEYVPGLATGFAENSGDGRS
jgi:hypothetical protein